MANKTHPLLEKFIPIAKGIAETFGSNCEVVLHDFEDMQNSIVTIENGHVTGRSIDSPMPEFSLNKIRQGKHEHDIINYTGKSVVGRELKSSTMFIKDDEGKVLGCLCINFDMTELISATNVLQDILRTDRDEIKEKREAISKVGDVLSDLVRHSLDKVGRPVIYLTKDEKVEIVRELDENGAFLIKGAIDYVANELQVSRYTIYNYLDEIRIDK